MTPERFFDYFEGKLSPQEKENLERELIAHPEMQEEFVRARQMHRELRRIETGEADADRRTGRLGRKIFVACLVLVALNVAFGLIYVFYANNPTREQTRAREAAIRQQIEHSVQREADAAFPVPTIGMEKVLLIVPRPEQQNVGQQIIDAAQKAGGSATRDLPAPHGFTIFALIPASAEPSFREMLARLGGLTPAAQASSVAEEPSSITKEPSSVTKEPSSVAEAPSSVTKEPSSVAEAPSSVAEEPSSVTKERSSSTEEPSSVTEAPRSVAGEHSSAPVEHSSAAVEHSTIAVGRSSAPVEHSTAPVERSTIAVERSSAAVERSSAAVERSSSPVEPSSTAGKEAVHLEIVIRGPH